MVAKKKVVKTEPEVKKAKKVNPGPKIIKPIINPEKELATKNGEAYISIVSLEVDPENIANGSFEFDWNDKWIAQLVKAGYEGKTDADIVERWFQSICRSVVMENYEQWDANYATSRRIEREDLGGGKSSVS